MDSSVLQFYNQLAGSYHLIFADWRQSVARQGQVLDGLIRAQGFGPPQALLDCACGIGTQAIGLAGRGYRVHATDLSPAAVERAAKEAQSLGVSLTVGAADMRRLAEQVEGAYDIIIACDNALPHLVEPDDLQAALENVRASLAPGGLFLASIRDYDRLLAERPRATPPAVYDGEQGRRILFQVWDWADSGDTYTVNQFLVQEDKDRWRTDHYVTVYRALRRDELSRTLGRTGFSEVQWHMPADSGYYQPVVTTRKA